MPARIDSRNRTLPRLVRGVAVLALGLGALSACGSDKPDDTAAASTTASTSTAAASTSESATTSGASEAQSLTAKEADFSISLDEDSLAAGSYTIEVVNDGNSTHDLAIEKDGKTMATSDSISPGDTATLTVDLEPGEYVFYCSIGNHRAMGMELTVQVT